MKKTLLSVAKFLGRILVLEGFIVAYAVGDMCYLVYFLLVVGFLAITHTKEVKDLADILLITATYRLLRMSVKKKVVYLGRRVRISINHVVVKLSCLF